MTKHEILEIFFQKGSWLMPDEVCRQLHGFRRRSSVYSYLFRLHKQGLLLRATAHGRIVYQISQRGIERLRFFRSQAGTPSKTEKRFEQLDAGNAMKPVEHS